MMSPAMTHCKRAVFHSFLFLFTLRFSQSRHGPYISKDVEDSGGSISREMRGQPWRDRQPGTFVGGDRASPGPPGPLGNCAGDCNANVDCQRGLYCIQREPNSSVPGCIGPNLDETSTDYCVHSSPGMLVNYGGTPRPYHYPLGECHGDCDRDEDCDIGLICYQRNPADIIPGCIGGELELSNSDYCVTPTCVEDCIVNSDCPNGFYCFHRVGNEDVPGYLSENLSDCKSNYCVNGTQGLLIDYGGTPPEDHIPLGECQGDCDNDLQCDIGLVCYQRDPFEAVPGCFDGDLDPTHSDYCVPPFPTNPPFYLPTPPDGTVTYHPGNLTTLKDNLLLSEGLDAKLLATANLPVKYHNGTTSQIDFHILPDGGATFADSRPHNLDGWVYVSNSEVIEGVGFGGVGALTFDRDGNVIDYRMVLQNSTWNCGGGKTPWNTWVSCEESPNGRIYQVDPFGERAGELTSIGSSGGSWESFAYDVRDPSVPRFFATEDAFGGALERFTPSNPDWNDTWSILHGPGAFDYLVLVPNQTAMGDTGTFYWTNNRGLAKASARQNYPHTEGIDFYEGQLFFVCKQIKMLFILDLDGGTYQRSSSQSGLFDGGPDQLKRILNSDDGLLYFTEDGGVDSGVHARDNLGRFYTILESPTWPGETTGLAFSPDGQFMYFAYQMVGKLYAVWRRDGLPFHATHLDVKYHEGV